jgi:hypothetical protein
MLADLLGAHPQVAFISRLDDRLRALGVLGRYNNALYRRLYCLGPEHRSQTAKASPRGLPLARLKTKAEGLLGPSEAYNLLSDEVSPLLVESFRDLDASDATPALGRKLEEFFSVRAGAQSRAVFVHHFTGWPRVGLLHCVFPEAHFIHLVRDGRSVASSLLNVPWWRGYLGVPGWGLGSLEAQDAEAWSASGHSFWLLAALEWKILMDAFEKAKQSVAPDYWHELRYEDLMVSPRPALGAMLEFMGLGWDSEFERALGLTSFDGRRSRSFTQEFSQPELLAIEEADRPQLERYGYEPVAGSR